MLLTVSRDACGSVLSVMSTVPGGACSGTRVEKARRVNRTARRLSAPERLLIDTVASA